MTELCRQDSLTSASLRLPVSSPHTSFTMSSQNEGPVIGTTVGHAVAQDFIALASNLGSEAGIPPLPLGMPSHLSHALAWSGADFIHEANYIYLLTEANLAEISTALAYFKGGRHISILL